MTQGNESRCKVFNGTDGSTAGAIRGTRRGVVSLSLGYAGAAVGALANIVSVWLLGFSVINETLEMGP